MRAICCFPLHGLALLAGCATVVPREPTPERPAPVLLPASESFVLHPRDGAEPYRVWIALPQSYALAPERRYPVVYSLDEGMAGPAAERSGSRRRTRLYAPPSSRGRTG